MGRSFQEFGVLISGLLCGAAFTLILLVVVGAIN